MSNRKEEREKSRRQKSSKAFLRPLFSFLFTLFFISCYTPPKKLCPERTHLDPTRASQVLSLFALEDDAPLCFGELWPSRVVTNGVYLLDERASIEETAAKLGHLSLHQKEAARFDTLPTKKEGCADWVDGLLVLEAKAYATELRLRQKLQVHTNPYEFEESFWAEDPVKQEGVILAYLRAHPLGGGGIDALGAAYLERCEQATKAQF
jgi:hypothetical protein